MGIAVQERLRSILSIAMGYGDIDHGGSLRTS
jgi:hypothetical protein